MRSECRLLIKLRECTSGVQLWTQ